MPAGEREFGELLEKVHQLESQVEDLKKEQKLNNEFLNKWKGVIGFFFVCAAVGGFVLNLWDHFVKH